MPLILLVDDDEDMCDLMRFYLEKEGFKVAIEENGILAETFCHDRFSSGKALPDLVITDIIMPEQGGVQTIINLRKNYPGMPILGISAKDKFGLKDFLSKVSFVLDVEILSKPFSEGEFLDAVNAHLI